MESPPKKKRLNLSLMSQQAGMIQSNMLFYRCVRECMSLGRKASSELLNLPLYVVLTLRVVVCRMLFAKLFQLAIGNIAVRITLVWLLCRTVACE